MIKKLVIYFLFGGWWSCLHAQTKNATVTIAFNGWANNSVNTVIFRKNALVTADGYQYTAYYDSEQYVVVGKRKTGSRQWRLVKTSYEGDASDAHKSISIMIDGDGYLHVVWGQHNNPLNYAKGLKPGSLELGAKIQMLGDKENKLSYPEFYKLLNGDLLFFYRDGGSGNGCLIANRYDIKLKTWTRLQDNLIDGEGQRSAYWQVCSDATGAIHISWVWRETPDVASNHDMAYACSKDGGKTWQTSEGKVYQLPITAANAEYALKIPQKSELINQTSMFVDALGHPFIASYWREQGQTIPQYHIVYKTGSQWQVNNLGFRKTAFSLSGAGTKQIPISRPQIIAWANGKLTAAALIFRDEELGSKVSITVSNDITKKQWDIHNLTNTSVGSWEPTYDTELWKDEHILDLFVQKNTQVDGEGHANLPPQSIQVIEWKPSINQK
ncbi:MAG: BNR repeat-containing protein [Mucilaginibacter sp.]|uniref:BNR repeat-containing protein n=1 Tax=Mucilaginibacter sp. TaxID=1882438 RepID=UPI0032651452